MPRFCYNYFYPTFSVPCPDPIRILHPAYLVMERTALICWTMPARCRTKMLGQSNKLRRLVRSPSDGNQAPTRLDRQGETARQILRPPRAHSGIIFMPNIL